MYKRIAILIFITLCCAAYAGDLAKIHSQLEPSKRVFSPDSNPLDGAAKGHGISEIALERGGGGGKFEVPHYQCVFRSDGTVEFTADPGASAPKVRKGKIERIVYNRLALFISQANLAGYADSYGGGAAMGQPVIYISAVKNGERKTIMDFDQYAPAMIWAIEELIDHVWRTSVQWDPPQLSPATGSPTTSATLQR